MGYLSSVCVGSSGFLEFSLRVFFSDFISFFYVILVDFVDCFIKAL